MLNNFFQMIERVRHKNKFVQNFTHNNRFGAWFVRRCWPIAKNYLYRSANATKLFTENADRINTITNTLSDEKSKVIYNYIIKFRQKGIQKKVPPEYCDEVQYFMDEMKFSKDEVFVDCGAYNGDTIEKFFKYCPEYKQIIAFEPEPGNIRKLQTKYQANPKIMLIEAGAWDKAGTVSFVSDGVFGTIVDDGALSIPVNSIDNLGLNDVTFIKMDIEGAEMKALIGAKNTILKYKPNLAICLYHSNEDMVDIPEYIHKLVPEYKLYVRHYDQYSYWVETILYAIL